MDGTWDLSILYQGFDDPKYAADLEKLEQSVDTFCRRIDAIAASQERMSAGQLAELLKMQEEIIVLRDDLQKYAVLRRETNAGEEAAAKYNGLVAKIYSMASGADTLLCRWIGEIELTEDDFKSFPILDAYRFYIAQQKKKSSHLMPVEAEALLAQMQSCAGNAWIDLRSYLASYAHAPLDGKEYTLTQLRGFDHHPSQAMRKAAFLAEIECSKSIEAGVCFALNSIKEQVLITSKNRGFQDVIDTAMDHSRMKRETLDALWDAVRQSLPKFRKYLKRKAEILGHHNGLPWYDLKASFGKTSRYFEIEEARAFLINRLGGFSQSLGELVDRAFREQWIDFYPHAGKTGGAFCRCLQPQGQSRILTNFDHTLSSVIVLAHELGHAYHNLQIKDHRPMNAIYTMPVGETASNFNEVLVLNDVIASAKDEEKLALIEQRLQDSTQTIVDIYSRFLFELSVFEERKKGFLFPKRLCELMLIAQQETYGDSLDPQWMHPYMWVNKFHYYLTHNSFYNFPYAFGLLLSNGLYARYQQEGKSFVGKYERFLHATTVSTIEDCTALAGIDVTKPDFWIESLSVIEEQIELFLALTERGKNTAIDRESLA